MSELNEQFPKGSVGVETINTQSQMCAAFAEFNQHNVERLQTEWQEAVDLFWVINGGMFAVDKVRHYQDWVKGFFRRSIEDVNYAMGAAQVLRNIEMNLSMGLLRKEDQEVAKAA